jgi:hypothetical protein
MTDYVHQPLTLWPVDDELDFHAALLAYGVDTPDEVELVLPRYDGSTPTPYRISRDTLARGLVSLAADGDVLVNPHHREGWLIVVLATVAGVRTFWADADVVRAFLGHTIEIGMEVAA